MKKGIVLIIIGALLVTAQTAYIVYDAVTGKLGTVLDGISGASGAAYLISYLAAGIAGLVLLGWGIAKLNQKAKS